MELQTHFNLYAILLLLKQGKIIQAVCLKPIGYHITETHVVLYCRGFKEIALLNLPYDVEYYNHCHQNSGYHEKHWSSNIKVRREVHEMYLYSSREELSIITTKPHVYDYLYNQYKVLHLLEGCKVEYGGVSISFKETDARGIGGSTEKKTFKNIVEYAKLEDQVKLIPRKKN